MADFTSNIKLEARVTAILDQVKNGTWDEDNCVEFKRQLTTPNARQLAGLLNAAGRHNCLMIIGADPDERDVRGFQQNEEFSVWLGKLLKRFDGLHPECRQQMVPYDKKSVMVIEFLSDRAPFVINRDDGIREVPWRAGKTRSATRQELLRILAPLEEKPYFLKSFLCLHRGALWTFVFTLCPGLQFQLRVNMQQLELILAVTR